MPSYFVFQQDAIGSIVGYPAQRGSLYPSGEALHSRSVLPTDPAGTFTLRLQNIIPGSRYRIETVSAGVALAEGVASTNTVNLLLQLYAAGSPYNDLRIKVRNASDTPAYRPFESQALAQPGTVAVYVFQEPDE